MITAVRERAGVVLNGWQFVCLVIYAGGLSVGQVLFKLAAAAVSSTGTPLQRSARLLIEPHFMLAVALYGLLSIAWVWILRSVPLSSAYPFVALSLVVTMAMAVFLFGESPTPRLVIGGLLVVAGIVVLSS